MNSSFVIRFFEKIRNSVPIDIPAEDGRDGLTYRDSFVIQLFEKMCNSIPNNVAAEDGEDCFTYRELNAKASLLAGILVKSHCQAGQVIPIVTSSCLSMITGILAILKIGAAYVPIDRSQWPFHRIQSVLGRIGARVVLYTGESLSFGGALAIKADGAYTGIEKYLDEPLSTTIQSELACVIFTSGTTNEPKGVMIRNTSLAHFVSCVEFNYNVTPEDRVLLVMSIAFDACMGTLFNTLCNGGTVVLASAENFQDRVRKCSVFVGTPSILESLAPPCSIPDYLSLDRIILGGETPSSKLVATWASLGRPIWIAYGPTEATCATLTGLITASPISGEFETTALGRPIEGATISIVDERMCEIFDIGCKGEILISGPGLARGYWKDDLRTRENFIMHNGKRAFRTGDQGKLVSAKGGKRLIYFCGRKDRIVKIRGFLVNLDLDVDAAIISAEPGVKAVHSILIDGRLHTAVVPARTDIAGLMARWRQMAPSYLIPDRIIALEALPLNVNGKIDFRKLRGIFAELCGEVKAPASYGSLQETILAGISWLLNRAPSSIDCSRSFIALGVHSLAATRISWHCRKHGYKVPVHDILMASSVEELSRSFASAEVRSLSVNVNGTSKLKGDISDGPLTDLQQQLVYGSFHDPKSNVVQHIATHHTRDIALLRDAWNLVARIEPIFQTVFEQRGRDFAQRLVDEPIFRWSEKTVDLDQVESEVEKCAENTGLGICFTVLHRREGAQSVLVWSIHHALIDGFSASLLVNKVQDILRGRAIHPSLPFTVAARQMLAVARKIAPDAASFWAKQGELFPDAAGDFQVPKPESIPSGSDSGESCIGLSITPEALAKYGETIDATSAAIHYATWALIVSIYTNSDTVLFGAVLSGRNLDFDWAETMIGPLINTLPFNIKIDRALRCRSFLHNVHSSIQQLTAFHATYRKSRSFEFGSVLAIQYDAPKFEPMALETLGELTIKERTHLPLTVLVESDGRIRFLYRRDHFGSRDIDALGSLYRNILQALLDPMATVQECLNQRFCPGTWQRILEIGNIGSGASYINDDPRTVTAQFKEAAIANPYHIAVEKGLAMLTYHDLQASITQVASVVQLFVEPGDVVCILADRSINWIVGMLAILQLSAVYCPLDIEHSWEYRAELLKSARAKLLLCSEVVQLREVTKDAPLTLCIDQVLRVNINWSLRSNPDNPTAVAFLCFTSGSTGKPKGILCEHRGIVAFHASLEIRLNSKPGIRIAQFASPGFDACIHEILASLCYGATLVLRKDPKDPVSHLFDVDVAVITPSVAASLEPSTYPKLKYVYVVGEPVPQKIVETWAPGRKLYNLYGPTEGTIGACQQLLKVGTPINIGPPVPSMRVYILNDHLELQPLGVIGNIFIAGVQVSRGYIHMADTQTEFLPDFFVTSKRGERMYRTGDMGFFDESGNVHYCGRRDRQIKLRGFRVNLDEISIVACQQTPDIRKAFAVEHNGSVVLWVEGDGVDTEALQAQLTKVLPKDAVPRFVAVMEKFPLSKNGKLDAKSLARQPLPIKGSMLKTTLSSWERLIAREWRLLLGLGPLFPLSGSDCFPSLGGHSVLQLQLTAHLNKLCNGLLTIKDVMYAPNLSSLATVVEQRCFGRDEDVDIAAKKMDYKPLGPEKLSPPEIEWWYRYTYSKHQATFNVPYIAELSPGVDLERLATSIEAVCSRHKILQSRYIGSDGNHVRRAISDKSIKVHRADSINVKEFINCPFDLADDQLVRVALSSSFLAISIHHILIDLTGLQILLSEVTAFYQGSELQPVGREYFDVFWWSQRRSLEDIMFWSSYFDGLSLLRGEETAQNKRSYRGTSLLREIPHPLYESLLGLISQEALSLHQFALTVTGIVLHTLCERNDVLLGAPFMNRSSVEDQKVVGLFLEAMPFRVRFADGNVGKADMLRSVKCSSQSVLAHAMPWSKLLDDFNLPFPSEAQQLFDCVVTVHDERDSRTSFLIEGVKPIPVWTEGAKFAALFEWHAFQERLTVRFEYDTDRLTSQHAWLVQDLVYDAMQQLLDPEQGTYKDFTGRLTKLLKRKCAEFKLDLQDVRRMAKRFLQGVV